jgi:hypothetical protein
VGASAPQSSSSAAACEVDGSVKAEASNTAIVSRSACIDSAPRSAALRALRFTFTV